MPDTLVLRKQALEALIEDRVLVTYARESGSKVDEPELDRVVGNVAAQNKLTLEQLRERLKIEGMEFRRFRENLRDQLLTERVSPGGTVMDGLRSVTAVETAYGGGFVASMLAWSFQKAA